jgi:hypothetical protein
MGLQAVNVGADRVARLNHFFETYRSQDEYDLNAITHVMACTSHFAGELLTKCDRGPVGNSYVMPP